MECKGLLMDVKRFAVHDGPGIRTTLFLKGCPLTCIWCHNPEGIGVKPQIAFYDHKCIRCGECVAACPQGAHRNGTNGHVFDRTLCLACGQCESKCLGEAITLYGRYVGADEAVRIAAEDEAFYGNEGGVTVSGGEPLLQADFVQALLRALKSRGIHTAVDTCGCVPWKAFEAVLDCADMFLFDIKHIDPEAHRRLTGRGNELILENITRLSQTGARIEVRIPLVPGCNDDPATLQGIARFLGALRVEKVKLLPYHALARSKYRALGLNDTMPQVESPGDERLHEVAALMRAYGVNALSGRD